MKRFLQLFIFAAVAFVVANGRIDQPSNAAVQDTAWRRPVPGAVVRAFRAPTSPYGPGHRGVDFAVRIGESVVAVGDGTVVFSGQVGGALHVVIAHSPSGWLTGYSFLASVRVHAGWTVRGGEVLGTAGGVGDGHDGSVVHVSLRIAGVYRDPMFLFHMQDLASIVHLAPMSQPRAPGDFTALPRV